MKIIYSILCALLCFNFALANNQDTVIVSSESNDILMFDDYSTAVSFDALTKEKVQLSRDSSMFSGVILAELTRTSQYNGNGYKNVFIGNYENGEIQSHVRISFTRGEFPKNQQENVNAGIVLAKNQSLVDHYEVESCEYNIVRKSYKTNTLSNLTIQIRESLEDTTSYREVTRDGETKITRLIQFSDNIRHECIIKKANKCIINIEGEGIIYLDLKGRVITKEEFLMISKELGSSSITRRYFSCDNEGYVVIFAFVKTRYKKKSSSIKSILKKRYKLDKRLKND